jgi:hypothetical protein
MMDSVCAILFLVLGSVPKAEAAAGGLRNLPPSLSNCTQGAMNCHKLTECVDLTDGGGFECICKSG